MRKTSDSRLVRGDRDGSASGQRPFGQSGYDQRWSVRDDRRAEGQAGEFQRRNGSSGGWRELLAGAGVRSAAISGSGVFRDAGTDERARQLFFNGLTPDFQVIIPDFGVVQGPFQVSALEYAGSLNGEATFELSLQSAGELVFTPDVVV